MTNELRVLPNPLIGLECIYNIMRKRAAMQRLF